MIVCKHCGRWVEQHNGNWGHVYGPGSIIIRCKPEETGRPYGLSAEPAE